MTLSLRSLLARRTSRRLVLAWLLAVGGSGAFLCAALWTLRAEALRAGERYAQSLVRLASEQTSRSFQAVSQALSIADADLADLARADRLDEATARTALASQLRYLPYVRALWFLDTSGVIRYDTDVGNIGVSLRDRDYFQAHQQARPELYVGQPVRSRSRGTWLVSASRASRAPDGRLQGVVAAAIEPPYFDRLWRAVELGADGVVGLYARDGRLMLRSPWVDEAVGRDFSRSWPFASGLAKPQGSAKVTSSVDGLTRLMAYRTLDEFPDLVVMVGVDQRLVLGPWTRVATVASAIWVVTMALLALLLLLWARESHRRHEAEQRSQRARRLEAVGTLAGGIAHDFNNVIGAVLGHARIARRQVGADGPGQQALRHIETSGLRARSLVQQILAFSRGEPEARAPVDLRPLVEETVGLLRSTLPARIRLETRLDERPVVVHADAGQMQQVVMNLCTNAWQAIGADEGGLVEVGLEARGAQARLWVQDTGKGMSAESLERIFEPFFTTKPKGMGTGLGLAVVHRIVAAHGGTVAAHSAEGDGATFDVHLPMVDTPATPPPAPAAGIDTLSPDGAGLRVLCVDDDEVILAMLDGVLTAQGFEVLLARSPDETLARLPGIADDLAAVVTDFDMPSASGVDLALRIRERHPRLPVLLMSGYINDEIEAVARRAGIAEMVPKERAYADLGAAIVRAVEGR